MVKNIFNQRGAVLSQSSSHCVPPYSGVPQAFFLCNEMGKYNVDGLQLQFLFSSPSLVYIQLIFGVSNNVSLVTNVRKYFIF